MNRIVFRIDKINPVHLEQSCKSFSWLTRFVSAPARPLSKEFFQALPLASSIAATKSLVTTIFRSDCGEESQAVPECAFAISSRSKMHNVSALVVNERDDRSRVGGPNPERRGTCLYLPLALFRSSLDSVDLAHVSGASEAMFEIRSGDERSDPSLSQK
jgi:hypothetical protein